MTTVDAKAFEEHLREFVDIAGREPVTITRPAQASLVLLSAENYERPREIEERATHGSGPSTSRRRRLKQ
jgi:PHD/YefM family antitoxin component YafN of YafNO toxin-antitoxin module